MYISTLEDGNDEGHGRAHTALGKDCEALLDQEVGVEDDETERHGQDIIARSNLEELANCFLLWRETAEAPVVSNQARTALFRDPTAGHKE